MLEHFELFNKISTEWSLKKLEYFVLNGLLCDLNPKNILEFGPGNSTIVLAKNAEYVETYESDQEWFEKYNKIIDDNNLNVKIFKFENEYPLNIIPLKDWYDIIFVDAPWGFWECPGFEDKSRFNTVEFASHITNKIILHDTKREREQNTIEYFKKKDWNELYFDTEL